MKTKVEQYVGGNRKGMLRIGEGCLNREEEKAQNNSRDHVIFSCALKINSQVILYTSFCVSI